MRPGDTRRQRVLLDMLAGYVRDSPEIGAMVLVGSFADETADAVSDLDLFFITYDGRFEDAWARRRDLHVTGALVDWDHRDEPLEVGGHRWVTPDLVVVECVISSSRGGARLAPPFKHYAGDATLVKELPKRPSIDEGEMTDEGIHPVESAYDAFKSALRAARRP